MAHTTHETRSRAVPHIMSPQPALGRGLVLLMALAAALSCAGNYFAQPLLDIIEGNLHIGVTAAGLIVTAAQAGYALGLILLVPLGDVMDRRRLAVGLFALTAVFLLATAAAPTGPLLIAGTLLTALTSVGAQVVVPFAAALAAPAERGRIVGVVMSGVLLGGLFGRLAAGALSEFGGWRTVYWVNALLMAVMAVLLYQRLPRLPRPGDAAAAMSYVGLLRSTLALLRQEPLLRRRAAIGAFSMASYSVQLTALTFLLTRPPFGWNAAAIGLFGLVGVIGVVGMNIGARLSDRGRVQAVSGTAAALLTLAWLPLLAGESSLLWLTVGVILLNIAQQAGLNSSQNVIYALRPEARNRVNSAFMTLFFMGGAAGAALASVVWSRAGWSGICLLGAVLAAGSLVLWVLERVRAASAARPGAVSR
ncbi:MFS transporter [Streptomyces sp. NBC_00893]|uniref:MFS transporter n=1 Tax=Streptomyces sp. NBC_00893 TaxID=2975862 RepID=UPI0022573FE6|nr:MFS transporter [Streptomyces sp. NBC_00893]MCX4850009.1 MFS transporter [Streptomyces sp. NBC_00893]